MPPALAVIQPAWQTYADELVMLGPGIALWEPAPLHNYEKVAIGDVGYIRHGAFHLIFSAAMPLGDRVYGTDVPPGFVPLKPGPINQWQPRSPGALRSASIDQKGGHVGASPDMPFIQAGTNLFFESSHKKGAILLTKFKTFREDVERDRPFIGYMKRNIKAWVDFASELGHTVNLEDIVLVTGFDMTLDFAMLAFSSNYRKIGIGFEAGLPGVASASVSAWGTWSTTTSAVENWGPQQREPPSHNSRPRIGEENSPGNDLQSNYNQCVFVRGFRMRRRAGLWLATVIKAAGGPHDLGSGHRFDEDGPLISSEDVEDSENEPVSTTPSFIDPLDPIFRYIFENSSAEIAILNDFDLNILMKATNTTTAENMDTLVSRLSADMIEIGSDGIACITEGSRKVGTTEMSGGLSILAETTSSPMPHAISPTLPGLSDMDSTHGVDKEITKPSVREFTNISCDACKEADMSCQMIFPCKNCVTRGVVCTRSSLNASKLYSVTEGLSQDIQDKTQTPRNTVEPRPVWNLSMDLKSPVLPRGETSGKGSDSDSLVAWMVDNIKNEAALPEDPQRPLTQYLSKSGMYPSGHFAQPQSEASPSGSGHQTSGKSHEGGGDWIFSGSSQPGMRRKSGELEGSTMRMADTKFTEGEAVKSTQDSERDTFQTALDFSKDAARLDTSGKNPKGAISVYSERRPLMSELMKSTERPKGGSSSKAGVLSKGRERDDFYAKVNRTYDASSEPVKVLQATHPAESGQMSNTAPTKGPQRSVEPPTK